MKNPATLRTRWEVKGTEPLTLSATFIKLAEIGQRGKRANDRRN
jgi:hypothetical protein